MSFLLDPFLAFMLGLIFSFFTKKFNFTSKTTFAVSTLVISLATSYSILLYMKIVKTDFLILDTFSRILPIEQQFGPRIMFHSNATDVTKEIFPFPLVVIFYALYFLWFYLGFKTVRHIMEPNEPTPIENPTISFYINIGGLLVFVSAGMMLFFFIMIPLDRVLIGDALGARSSLQNKEAAFKGYMANSNAKFSHFSDNLCRPEKIEMEKDPPRLVDRDSAITLVVNELPTVTKADLREMCQSRENLGNNIVFIFDNISTWMFLIAIFMVTTPRIQKNGFWDYQDMQKLADEKVA
jgi:hypothetical protein